jgi:hypothetical protein
VPRLLSQAEDNRSAERDSSRGYPEHDTETVSYVQIACQDVIGRAASRAVSRWHSTAEVRVPGQFRSCGIYGRESGTGAGLLRVLFFPLALIIPTTPNSSSSIIRGWYNMPIRQIMVEVQSGCGLTPPQESKNIKTLTHRLIINM